VRMLKVLSEATAAPASAAAARDKTDALMDRFASLEKRIDYAASKSVSLDQELAALADEAALEADLAALRKGAKKSRK